MPIHHSADAQHLVVRVPAQAASVLNSKDKAPYIIYVEVVEVADCSSSPTPEKILNNLRHVRSEEQLPENGSDVPPPPPHPPSSVASGATPGGGSSNSSHSGATAASHQVGGSPGNWGFGGLSLMMRSWVRAQCPATVLPKLGGWMTVPLP